MGNTVHFLKQMAVCTVHRRISSASIAACSSLGSLSQDNCIKEYEGLGSLKGLLFSCIISHSIGGFKDVCKDSCRESFEEEISGFSIFLGIASLSGVFFKVSDVLSNIRPLHVTLFKGNSSSLLLVRVLELGFKFIKELSPDDGEIVLDLVKSVNPDPHISDPSGNFISFDKGEGEGDFLD